MKPLLLVASILVMVVAGGWQRAPVAADEPVFVFSGWNDENNADAWDLYSLTLSGESKIIVGGPENKVYPFPFPNERAIGYLTERSRSDERQIFKHNLDSRADTPLGISIYADSTCQVSPDGKQLACGDRNGRYSQIVVFDLATKAKRQLTSFKNYCTDPSWSPDGKNLVYVIGALAEIVGGAAKPPGKHLVVYNFDTNTHRLLTRVQDAKDGYPRWSPDGQWVAFHRPTKVGRGWNLWLIRPNGTEETQLTVTDREDSHPEWSPDSKRIAFQSYRSRQTFDIYIVDVATKSLTRVTETDDTEEQQPIWIPQAKR
jgi:Tol biopolymer transport system component